MTQHGHHHHDNHRHDDDHDGDHGGDPTHRHHHEHTMIGLTPALDRSVHRVGRRQFLRDLGRGTFAVAILGGVAACGNGSSGSAGTTRPAGNTADDAGSTPTDPTPGSTAAATAAANELRWSQVVLGSVSAYVLVRGNEAAVVDTGNPGSADQIGEALGTLGVTYDDVRHVVLTHRHPDHIGSLPAVLERSASAAAYAGADDIPNIEAPIEVTAVGDGDDVFGLEVIATPGHTPGSISVLDTGIGLLIAGDAMIGNAAGDGLSGASERFTADMEQAGESIRKLTTFDFDIAAFGHGNPVIGGASQLVDALVASS